MKDTIEVRTIELGEFILETKATVRAAAKKFHISKSTVHKDLSQRLPYCNQQLYQQVRQVLEHNKSQRHIRGGIATKQRYRSKK